MTRYEIQYNNELNVEPAYREDKQSFMWDLLNFRQLDDFLQSLRDSDDDFYVAVDWSIPVVFVKYFRKNLEY